MPAERRPHLPARQGIEWWRGSFRLLAAQPLRLLAIGLVLQLLAGYSQAGFLGLVFLLLMPALSAGVLEAMRQVRQGAPPRLMTLFAAFKAPPVLGRLVLLGMLVVACAVLGVALGLAGSLGNLDPDLLARLEAGDTTAVAELDPALLQGALFALLMGMFIGGSLAFYAVPLIWFSGQGLWHAIGAGFMGMVREWRALLVLGLMFGALSFPVALLVAAFLVTPEGASLPVKLMLMLVIVLFQLLLFAAQYLSWADIFGTPDLPKPAQNEAQLVA